MQANRIATPRTARSATAWQALWPLWALGDGRQGGALVAKGGGTGSADGIADSQSPKTTLV